MSQVLLAVVAQVGDLHIDDFTASGVVADRLLEMPRAVIQNDGDMNRCRACVTARSGTVIPIQITCRNANWFACELLKLSSSLVRLPCPFPKNTVDVCPCGSPLKSLVRAAASKMSVTIKICQGDGTRCRCRSDSWRTT